MVFPSVISTRNDATLHLLFVIDELPKTIDPRSTELSKDTKENVRKLLHKVAFQLDYDDMVPAVKTSSVLHEICSYTRENDADLIVIGTYGWSGFTRFLVGSFTERVIQTTPVPVLTTAVSED